MRWSSAIASPDSSRDTAESLLLRCAEKIRKDLDGSKPDILIGFVSPHFLKEYEHIPGYISSMLEPGVFLGCSAGGLIGNWREIEQQPAISLTAAILPDVDIRPFYVSDELLPDLDAAPGEWEKLVGVNGASAPNFILLSDPFSLRIDELLQGLDYAFPKSVKLGGLASGAGRPGLNALFLDQQMHRGGAVGVAITGNVLVDTVVAQGCRPVGHPMRVTRCLKNFIYELDGEPAITALHDLLLSLDDHDQAIAKHSLFLGVVMDEFKQEPGPGDFLVRNILGLEPSSGALLVGEVMRNERTVQFHLRDASTSAEDLRLLLKGYRETRDTDASGALLFSCLGRGQYLYGRSNHDSECFREYLGDVPLGGFFCNGEIGPVGGSTFLHGYTSSFGIFRPRENA
jgi:small ligand-binding sensory domain FIST